MATVPGSPNVVPMLPEWAKPTQADFLQAAAIMHEREQVKNEQLPFGLTTQEEYRKGLNIENFKEREPE